MALASASPFASFDVTDGSQIRDISSVLSEAIFLDLNLLSEGINVDFGDPVNDTTYYWNEEALNARTATVNGSITSVATTLVLASGHGTRVHIGDLVYDTTKNSTEVLQVTDISTDTLTVVRGYNSTTAAVIADQATVAIVGAYQEGTDITTTDKSVKPVVRSNFTQIIFAGDLLISRTQRNRQMATVAMDVERQLANRATELKFDLSRMALYGEKSASSGSDTVYRTCGGMRYWIRQNGVTNSSSEALALTVLNTHNKSLVDLGKYANRVLIGTDLVNSIAAIDSGNRRMLESDRSAGYTVQEVTLAQGNRVNVIVDGRVKAGDCFLYNSDQVTMRPFAGSGMFVISATDFVDGVKRRLGSEWGLQFRNPEAAALLSNKT